MRRLILIALCVLISSGSSCEPTPEEQLLSDLQQLRTRVAAHDHNAAQADGIVRVGMQTRRDTLDYCEQRRLAFANSYEALSALHDTALVRAANYTPADVRRMAVNHVSDAVHLTAEPCGNAYTRFPHDVEMAKPVAMMRLLLDP